MMIWLGERFDIELFNEVPHRGQRVPVRGVHVREMKPSDVDRH